MLFSPAVDLVLVSALFAVITQTLQSVLTNRKEIRENQKKMQEKNKQYRELMTQGNKANPQELERVQKEIMELTTTSMKSMPKMLVANMIVFLPLFAMVSQTFNGIQVPLFFPFKLVWETTDWLWYYVLCSFLISMFVNQVFNWHLKKQETKTGNATQTAHTQ
jgi:uncharacterized membrane protein (DUF106 family)